jgi:hypothetical protein
LAAGLGKNVFLVLRNACKFKAVKIDKVRGFNLNVKNDGKQIVSAFSCGITRVNNS